MGDPKKLKKKYRTPSQPWQRERIEQEAELVKKYGFKNKREIYKMSTLLQSFKQRMKETTAIDNEQARKEQRELLMRLYELGLTETPLATEDDVLGLRLEQLLERRLQTILVKKGLAKTPNQARQFITHRHVVIGEKKITSPSYLVKRDEQDKVRFGAKSEPKLISALDNTKAGAPESAVRPFGSKHTETASAPSMASTSKKGVEA